MADDARPDLRSLYPAPGEDLYAKVLDHIDVHAKNFIALSPLMMLASSGPKGADCSPRGDPPGFVRVLDEKTLLVPDRAGNKLIDSLTNLEGNPEVGLLFIVPGFNETLRVNGSARIVTSHPLFEDMKLGGKVPVSALEVTVKELFFHCGRALIRAGVWKGESWPDRKVFPPMGKVWAEQIKGADEKAIEDDLTLAYTKELYE